MIKKDKGNIIDGLQTAYDCLITCQDIGTYKDVLPECIGPPGDHSLAGYQVTSSVRNSAKRGLDILQIKILTKHFGAFPFI